MTISKLPRPPTDSETELGLILEGIGEGFYGVDRDWRVRRYNSEAARHFGRAPAEVLGGNLWELFPGARETDLGRLFLQAMATRKAVRSETASVVVAGRWLSYGLFPLGEGLGVVFRDITDRKKAERAARPSAPRTGASGQAYARHGSGHCRANLSGCGARCAPDVRGALAQLE